MSATPSISTDGPLLVLKPEHLSSNSSFTEFLRDSAGQLQMKGTDWEDVERSDIARPPENAEIEPYQALIDLQSAQRISNPSSAWQQKKAATCWSIEELLGDRPGYTDLVIRGSSAFSAYGHLGNYLSSAHPLKSLVVEQACDTMYSSCAYSVSQGGWFYDEKAGNPVVKSVCLSIVPNEDGVYRCSVPAEFTSYADAVDEVARRILHLVALATPGSKLEVRGLDSVSLEFKLQGDSPGAVLKLAHLDVENAYLDRLNRAGQSLSSATYYSSSLKGEKRMLYEDNKRRELWINTSFTSHADPSAPWDGYPVPRLGRRTTDEICRGHQLGSGGQSSATSPREAYEPWNRE